MPACDPSAGRGKPKENVSDTFFGPLITVNELLLARLLVAITRSGGCGPVRADMLADMLATLLDRSNGQPESSAVRFSMRVLAARLYARCGDWRHAEQQARAAWESSGYLPAGVLLVRAGIHNGKLDEADDILSHVEAGARPHDTYALGEMRRLRQQLSEARNSTQSD